MTIELNVEANVAAPAGNTHLDTPTRQRPTVVKTPPVRSPISHAETHYVSKDNPPATYTVGSYLAARLSQIGLKHHFVVAGSAFDEQRHEADLLLQ